MYRVKNKTRQKLPIDIVEKGNKKRVFLKGKGVTFSEEITTVIGRLEKQKILVVKEVDEEEDEFESSSTQNSVEDMLGNFDEGELKSIADELEIPLHNATKKETLIRKLLEFEDRVAEYLSEPFGGA